MTVSNEMSSMPPIFDIEAMIEALLFVSTEPLSAEKITEDLEAVGVNIGVGEIKKALSSLLARWGDPCRNYGRGIILQRVAGGYAFATAPEQANLVKMSLKAKPVELTKAQAEVLSIVAYRQPLTRMDIDDLRGVDSSFAIKRLMQFKLLKILGKSEGLGRPLLYGTTKHFLEFFSLNSLNDLPTLKSFEELGRDEDIKNIDLDREGVSLKDLFLDGQSTPMFSAEIERQSDDSLKNLDEALLQIERVEKKHPAND
jgi:segregation and condensation protein B